MAISDDASDLQVSESRKCFYAGFYTLMQINYALGDGSIPEEEGLEYLNKLNDELIEFMSINTKGEGSSNEL